jgi:hypothetical protein
MILVVKISKRCYHSILQQLQKHSIIPQTGLIVVIDLQHLSRHYLDDVVQRLRAAFTGHYTISDVHQVYFGFEPFFSLCLTPCGRQGANNTSCFK